jgi:hypothetical protein
MPFLALVEVIEKLSLLYSGVCILSTESYIALETSSFFQLVTRPLATLVTCLLDTVPIGATILMPVTLDFP